MIEGPLFTPEWSLPSSVHAFVSTRHDGMSKGQHAAFNLADHVEDQPQAVQRNRDLLRLMLEKRTGQKSLQLQWAQQVHGTHVHVVKGATTVPPPTADALYTKEAGIVLSVLTADCLPVLFCSADGREIAVAHAGWRGLCNGVLEATVASFKCAPEKVRCWLGPAIGSCHFEVGNEVREAFLMLSRQTYMMQTKAAFAAGKEPGKWMADLFALAHVRLIGAGVVDISGQTRCVACEPENFYSYRLQAVTGRFATGIVRC